jgi:tetratricopeptide (TPR) repeat protein
MTWRPEFHSPWSSSAMHSVGLTRLGDAETRALVTASAANRAIPETLLDEIVARADGIPLFAEELAKSVLDQQPLMGPDLRHGDLGAGAEPVVPSTLQGSLMGRLDRLSSAKVIAQLAATIGREFSYDLIQSMAGLDDNVLRAGLAQLVEAEVLFQQGLPPRSAYAFKHALLQDTAYESQPRTRRREIHGVIAETLEKQYPERAAADPQLVARHAALGGQVERAITYYERAGQLAINRLANAEAVDYFDLAIGLLESRPADVTRNLREAELRLAALGPLSGSGYESARVVAQLERLEVLAKEIPVGPQRIPILLGLAGFVQAMGDLPRSGTFATELLEIVEPIGIPVVEAAVHVILGSLHLCVSTIDEALPHLERAREIAGEGVGMPPPGPLDLDLAAITQSCYGLTLALVGRPDAAREAMARCAQRAVAAEHAYGKTSHAHATMIAFYLDDPITAGEIAETCLGHIEGLGFHQVEAIALIFQSWSRVRAGDLSATSQAREGIEIFLSSGARSGIIQHHLVVAEIFALAGDFASAARYVDDAAEWIEKTGERAGFSFQIPMYRAEILLASGSPDLEQARVLLLDSLDQQRPFGSPWTQLRIGISLANIGVRGHGAQEARALLEETLDALPKCEGEPRVRLAQQLLRDLAAA